MQIMWRCAVVFSLLLSFVSVVRGASTPVTVRVEQGLFEIQTEQATLSEILGALSVETGMKVVMHGSPGEGMACAIKAQNLEQGLSQLLGDRNYVLFRRQGSEAGSAQLSLWVYEKKAERQFVSEERKSNAVVTIGGEGGPLPAPKTSLGANGVNLDRFVRALEKEMPLGEQITAEPVADRPPGAGGIRITGIVKGSALENLGLAGGDIVDDVTGSPVKSLDDLFSAMRHASDSGMTIRISRYRLNEQGEPVADPIRIEPLDSH